MMVVKFVKNGNIFIYCVAVLNAAYWRLSVNILKFVQCDTFNYGYIPVVKIFIDSEICSFIPMKIYFFCK